MNASKTIPIVMVGSGLDPVKAGLVESLARPGGNMTGITYVGPELGGKRLELFKDAVPKVSRVGFSTVRHLRVASRGERGSASRGACPGVDSSALGGRDVDGFERVFAALNKQRPDDSTCPWAR